MDGGRDAEEGGDHARAEQSAVTQRGGGSGGSGAVRLQCAARRLCAARLRVTEGNARVRRASKRQRLVAKDNGGGLRHFSLKVCEKVQEKNQTTYAEVADELVAEISAQNRFTSPSAAPAPVRPSLSHADLLLG
eukprot:COSAG03_NODE_1797_length_3507_cov_380.294014_3_plen_134_part_00